MVANFSKKKEDKRENAVLCESGSPGWFIYSAPFQSMNENGLPVASPSIWSVRQYAGGLSPFRKSSSFPIHCQDKKKVGAALLLLVTITALKKKIYLKLELFSSWWNGMPLESPRLWCNVFRHLFFYAPSGGVGLEFPPLRFDPSRMASFLKIHPMT